jgi:hypothetical protein
MNDMFSNYKISSKVDINFSKNIKNRMILLLNI